MHIFTNIRALSASFSIWCNRTAIPSINKGPPSIFQSNTIYQNIFMIFSFATQRSWNSTLAFCSFSCSYLVTLFSFICFQKNGPSFPIWLCRICLPGLHLQVNNASAPIQPGWLCPCCQLTPQTQVCIGSCRIIGAGPLAQLHTNIRPKAVQNLLQGFTWFWRVYTVFCKGFILGGGQKCTCL